MIAISKPRKLRFKSFGCQTNVSNSNRMADTSALAGFAETAEPGEADLVILNTCHIREKAVEKVYSEIGRIRVMKEAAAREGRRMLIAVAGCVAQAEGEEIVRRAGTVDLVVGSQNYHRLPDLLARAESGEKVVDTEFPLEDKFESLAVPAPAATAKRGVASFVTVQEGCDKFCTFCVVPYTRGPELSRPVDDVLAECAGLLAAGSVELTLLGQNVNGYRGAGPDGEEWDFTMLLYAVARLPGLKRLRFTTSHPIEMNAGLAEAFAVIPALMPYLHLPVQSGSDRMLRAMHRGHTRAQYLEAIAQVRRHCPDMALSSDFIVGFPGETDEDFAQTLDLVRLVRFDSAFCFKYSPRPGTPAAKAEDSVPEDVKDQRLQQLLALMREQSRAAHAAQVGKTIEVLVDKAGRNEGDMEGRTPDFKIVHFEGRPRQIGSIVPVRITAAYGQSLRGEQALAE